MKFTLANAFDFGWEGIKGQAYNSKNNFPHASAAYFEVTGRHGKVKTSVSDRTYLVLDGQGTFVVGAETFSVAKTDVVIIPKNTSYDYRTTQGTMKLFLVHSPAFDPEAEEKLE